MSIVAKSKDFISKFSVLKTAPRELWVVYLINIIEYVAYSFMQFSLMLWLINDLQQTDENAAWVLMVWGMVLSLMMAFAGILTDSLGVKTSFLLGYLFCAVGRGFMAYDSSLVGAVIAGLAPVAIGMALMTPVATAAIRFYTNKAQRSIAFSLFYVLFNVGYAIGGWGFDSIREIIKAGGDNQVELAGMVMSEFQFMFFLASILTIVGLVIIQFFIRPKIEVDEETGEIKPIDTSKKEKVKNPITIFMNVVKEKRFWIFLMFLLFLIGAKSVFYHMHYSLPPFAERYLGEGAKFGRAWGFYNPLIVIIFVPFIGAIAQKISSFKMIIWGTIISSLSVFILCIPAELFQGAAEGPVGDVVKFLLRIEGPLHPWYIPLMIFVFIFTIGEGIWSPRLMEYTASIAPPDRVGSYVSLSILPWFASKPLVALVQVWILPTYAPKEGPINPFMFWGIIGLMAITSPILVLLFKNVIKGSTEQHDEENIQKDDVKAESEAEAEAEVPDQSENEPAE